MKKYILYAFATLFALVSVPLFVLAPLIADSMGWPMKPIDMASVVLMFLALVLLLIARDKDAEQ